MMKKHLSREINDLVGGRLTSNEIELLIDFLMRKNKDSIDTDSEVFFRDLAYEMTGQVRELASLIVDFKKDLRSKIHPELTDITVHYIPQVADQLETIIEATEKAANKIMDNLEGMQGEFEKMERIVSSMREGSILVPARTKKEMKVALDSHTRKTIVPLVDYLESHINNSRSLISDSFIQMSFQDLTGQRIKGLISLFGQIEGKLKKMVISLGIKLTERVKNPHISGDALQRAVEEKATELAGPQKEGKGLDQASIDELLANL